MPQPSRFVTNRAIAFLSRRAGVCLASGFALLAVSTLAQAQADNFLSSATLSVTGTAPQTDADTLFDTLNESVTFTDVGPLDESISGQVGTLEAQASLNISQGPLVVDSPGLDSAINLAATLTAQTEPGDTAARINGSFSLPQLTATAFFIETDDPDAARFRLFDAEGVNQVFAESTDFSPFGGTLPFSNTGAGFDLPAGDYTYVVELTPSASVLGPNLTSTVIFGLELSNLAFAIEEEPAPAPAPVPTPATFMTGLGLLGLMTLRRQPSHSTSRRA